MSDELVIKDLHAKVAGGETVLKGVNLTVKPGEVHAIMGPNGSGKSTLSYVLMGHPNYEVEKGEVTFRGENVLEMEPDERAKLGLFLGFQYPSAVPGVTVMNFLRAAYNAVKDEDVSPMDFSKILLAKMDELEIDKTFARRYVNAGFSGGEKKRLEILQMAILGPKLAILDEPDSGLDIDAVKAVADGVTKYHDESNAFLLITHYQRILNYVTPDRVSIIMEGRVVKEGGPELALKVEEEGYDWLRTEQAA